MEVEVPLPHIVRSQQSRLNGKVGTMTTRKKNVKPAGVGETGISPTRKEKSRPILTENNSELKSSDNVAKDTSQEKENM